MEEEKSPLNFEIKKKYLNQIPNRNLFAFFKNKEIEINLRKSNGIKRRREDY